jgi:hypothetical protein
MGAGHGLPTVFSIEVLANIRVEDGKVTATNVLGLLPRKLAQSSAQLRHHATGIPFATVFWPTENASDGVC